MAQSLLSGGYLLMNVTNGTIVTFRRISANEWSLMAQSVLSGGYLLMNGH
jgi:hypothetical protein